jgi:hypothetical protein
VARPVFHTLCLAGVSFVACQVYDASLLTGAAGVAGRGQGGSGATAGVGGVSTAGTDLGGGVGGASSGGTASGGTGDGGTLANPEAGAGGEGDETSGGTAGVGGSIAGASGKGGGGGASGGVAGTSGASGKGGGAGAGAGGKGGTAGTAGTPATGGAGSGAGGAGSGGAGAGGAGTSGTAGSGGSSPTEVELMGTATADSEEATTNQMHPAAHGNDGDLATRWCAANGGLNHYWTLDLGAVHELTRLEIVWEYPPMGVGYPYRYRVDVSTNGTTFTTAIDKTANAETTAMQAASFQAGAMARHVRIVVTGLHTGVWASFFEASVYGY